MPHNHLIFSFAAMGMTQVFWHDPALPFVECRRAQHSRACYRPHSHPTLSIGAVDAGHTTLSIECAQPVRLTAGDVVLIPPHRVHSCNPDRDGEWSYQMLYLEEQWVLDLLSESPSSVPRITLDPLSWQDKAGGYGALSQLSADLFAPLECEHKESLLIDFVGQLLVMRAPEPAEARPEWLPEIQQRLDQQCEAVWPIGQLAAAVGLSRFHFIRAFHANTGMTPHAFQLDCRINRARRLLRAGVSLAETAQSLGFSDQSHFQHAFKQRVAVTPRQYLGSQQR